MKVKRDIIEIDESLCNGCGQCVPACAEGAIEIVNGKARLVGEIYCDGLGACLGECPTGALTVVTREAEDFDPEAVEQRLETLREQEQARAEPLACGCPSSQIMDLRRTGKTPAPRQEHGRPTHSELTHWPVKLYLVPEHAPFLKDADILICADCAVVAHPAFHRDLLKDKVVLTACPKFDNAEAHVEKLARIFARTDIRSVTVVEMEVPCCSRLIALVAQALDRTGNNIPLQEIIVSRTGDILEKREQTKTFASIQS